MLFLFYGICFSQQDTSSISGTVSDSATHEPLAGVNVLLRGTVRGTVTDSEGKFTIRNVHTGTFELTFSLLGYTIQTLHQITVRSGAVTYLTVEMVQKAIQTEQLVVTAGRREQSLREVPVSVSIMTSRMVADHAAVTLDDAIRYVPGVNMMQDQVNIRGSSGYSRGVGSRVLVLLDGLPYLTGDTGEINWESFPVYEIDRIEVVKGAGSALYGSNALGGVINIITKEIGNEPSVRFRFFCGMYDDPPYSEWIWTENKRFNTGGFVSYSNRAGRLGYLMTISRTVDESYRQNDLYHRWGLYSKFSYDFSPTSSAALLANVSWRDHGNFFWWKSLDKATKPANDQLNGEVYSTRGNISFVYKKLLSEKISYSLKSIYYGNFWKDDSLGHIRNRSSSHSVQLDAQAIYIISPVHLATFGLTGSYDHIYSNIFGSHPGIGCAAYLQYEFKPLEALKLTAGTRYDWQRIWKGEFSSPSSSSPSQLNPKIGLVLSPNAWTTLRASYGKGFRYPSMSELYTSVEATGGTLSVVPNDELKPERSTSMEAGCTQMFSRHAYMDIAVFQNTFYDLIEGSVNADKLEIQFRNLPQARIRGIEAGLRADWLHPFLSTDLSYTYMEPKDMTTGSVLKFRPRNLFYASLTATYKQLQAVLNYRYISRIEAIDENLVRLAPIVDGDQRVASKVVDAGISYNLMDKGLPVTIGLTVKNLNNYAYAELVGNLSPVRTYYVSIEGTW
jgi:outer membrane receptor for ferrienterochelin and colicins